MKTITIGFSHSNNLFSKIIMAVTRSSISHTYIRLNATDVFQASGLYVNEMVYEYFLTLETVVKEVQIQVTDEQFAAGEAFRLACLGKPYSMKEVFGFGWVMLMRSLFNKKVSNPGKDGDSAYVCSKLVCLYAGIPDAGENLTPDDLYLMLGSNQTAQI
jgi:hypothetical protein